MAEGLGVDTQELLREAAYASEGGRARRFLTNENGERTAVVLPIGEYEELLELAEDAEALREADEALARGEKPVPWESVRYRIGSEYEPDRASASEAGSSSS